MIGKSVAEMIIVGISEKNNYPAKIVRELGLTYAHSIKILEILEKNNIIKKKKKEGRKVFIELTDKGKIIQYHLKKISELL